MVKLLYKYPLLILWFQTRNNKSVFPPSTAHFQQITCNKPISHHKIILRHLETTVRRNPDCKRRSSSCISESVCISRCHHMISVGTSKINVNHIKLLLNETYTHDFSLKWSVCPTWCDGISTFKPKGLTSFYCTPLGFFRHNTVHVLFAGRAFISS